MRETSCCLFQTIIKLILLKFFNSTSRYLDDLLNIDNPYFEQMVDLIYPTELQLNKANSKNLYPPTKGYLRETCKSENKNPIYLTLNSPTLSFRL